MISGLLPPLISRTSTMPSHSCVCPDALDRCDVLLDFPSLHLVAVTQAPTGLVLEVESCDPVTGCPGCGVIATGHGRVMVEMIDAPWAGRPVRIRWRKRRWICLEDVCAVVSFIDQDPQVQPVLAQAAGDPSRFEGVQVLGVDEHIWHHLDPRDWLDERRWTRSRAARTRSMTSSKTPFVCAGRLPRRQARRR